MQSRLATRALAARWATIVFLGLVVGIATALADASVGFPPHERPWVRAFVVTLNLATTWAVVAFLAGRLAGRWHHAALAGVIALLLAVLGYYAYGVTLGDRTEVGLGALLGAARGWIMLAVVVGVASGLLGAASRRPGGWGLAAVLPLPTLALLEVFGRIGWEAVDLVVDPVLGWTLLVIVAASVALLLALVGALIARRWSRT